MVRWAIALSALAAFGCGTTCGDTDPTGGGTAYVTVDLAPQSQVIPPETFVISSPVQKTGTIDQFDRATPNGASGSDFSASVHEDVSGARSLFIIWTFTALDHDAPPSDQFAAIVTDAAGTVTGQAAETVTYSWKAPDSCDPGHWQFESGAN